MHVDLLPITFLAVDYRCDEHQCVFGYEIPYTSFPSCVCCKIEFKCEGEGEEGE